MPIKDITTKVGKCRGPAWKWGYDPIYKSGTYNRSREVKEPCIPILAEFAKIDCQQLQSTPLPGDNLIPYTEAQFDIYMVY